MPKKILIVEDEVMLREMYVQKFSQIGLEVVSASTAEEGLRMVRKEKPDLVLLDILLPKGNGTDMLKKLREDSVVGQTNVVAFSNFDDPIAKTTAEKLGVLDYLIKTNYTPKQIVERVKKYLK